MQHLNGIQLICVWALPILFAVTLHEAAHGWVAYKLGDDTAYQAGRISANPLRHIDLIGTIILPLILLVTTSFILGWAKPVPVNANRLRKPKPHMALVALAGPGTNFLMAIFWTACLKCGIFILPHIGNYGVALLYMSQAGILINLMLMVFNLLPIPPLDGSRLVTALLPFPWDVYYNKISPYGFLIVLILVSLGGVLAKTIAPVIFFLQQSLFTLFQI